MERTFGAYQLGETLAQLPFGELVAATHPVRSEALALLLLEARLSGDHRFRGLIRLEMARAGGLRQAGIARVVEVGEQSGTLAVVYERPAASTSLAARLTDGAPVGQDATLGLVRQLAAALDTAHGRRIVHGVLGPAAVLIGPDLTPAVVGIGLLAAVEEAGLRDAVQETMDAAFMAPEQAGGKLAVASADGYALAVLAERLLSDTGAAGPILQRQQSANVSDRYPSCTAFADALTAAFGPADTASGATTAAQAAPAWTPPPPPPSALPPSQPAPVVAPPSPVASSPSVTSPPSVAPPSSPSISPALAPAAAATATTPPWDESPPSAASAPLSPVVDAPPPYSPPTAPPSYEPPPWAVPPSAGAASPADVQPADAQPATVPRPSYASPSYATPPSVQPSTPPAPSFGRPVGSAAPSRPESTAPGRGGHRPPAIVRMPPTPVMLACLREAERTDILTEAVLAVADRVPALQQLVERHAPKGRVGPVPLGAAVAGVLCLLLLLLNLPALAGILVALVLGVYVLPPLLKKITAAEQPPIEAIRATGDMSIRAREVGPQWELYELVLGDGATLTLTGAGYRRLTTVGQPVTVEKQGRHGVEYVAVAHELPGLTVTYLLPARLLLDVRDAEGTVIHRHPEYAGEPGDRANIAQAADASGRPQRRFAGVEPPDTAHGWRPTAYGHRMIQRLPPPLSEELRASFKSAAIKAGLVNAVPVAIVLVSMISGDFGFFAFMIGLGIFLFVGLSQLRRAHQLWTAHQAQTIVRVAAQVRLQQIDRRGSRGSKTSHYVLRLDDGKELTLAQEQFGRLRQVGRPVDVGEGPGFWESLSQREQVAGLYEVDGLTVTYEPSSDLLLEIMDAAGTTYYRDSAVSPQSLGTPPPLPAPE